MWAAGLPKGCTVPEPIRLTIRSTFPIRRDKTAFCRPLTHKGSSKMRAAMNRIKNFLEREDGPTAVEYAVMLALIVVVCITTIGTLGTNANNIFGNVALNT